MTICTSSRTWHGKTACLVKTSHTCHRANEICTQNDMQLYTINDDFDMMLIFYFTTKQFREQSVEFWVKIYGHDECVSLTSERGNFNIKTDGFDRENDEKYFYCEFKSKHFSLL